MHDDAPRPPHRTGPPILPHQALLDLPNEVATPDFGLFRDVVVRRFYPAEIHELDHDPAAPDPRVSAVDLGLTTIGVVRPGTTIGLDLGDPPDDRASSAYHVNVVLDGLVASRSGDQEVVASPQMAAAFSPHRHSRLPRWDADAAQLSIKLTRTRVEDELAALLGRPVVKPIGFRLAFPVDQGPGRRWAGVLSALLQAIGTPAEPTHPHHLELLQRSLISGLLLTQPHSYTEQLTTAPTRPGPRGGVDRVVEEIRRAPDRGYTLGDLARLSGMSARSLQYAFRERYDLSPMQYLRHIRLDRAHHDLREGLGSVAEVGAYWGFTNPGRFARAYRTRFGEFPAATRGRESRRS